MNKTTRQEMSKARKGLTPKNQPHLTNMYRTRHPTTMAYAFCLCAHMLFSRIWPGTFFFLVFKIYWLGFPQGLQRVAQRRLLGKKVTHCRQVPGLLLWGLENACQLQEPDPRPKLRTVIYPVVLLHAHGDAIIKFQPGHVAEPKDNRSTIWPDQQMHSVSLRMWALGPSQ